MSGTRAPFGRAHVGLALVWLLPSSGQGQEEADPFSEIPTEELAYLEHATGVDARELVARVQDLASAYRQRPEACREELHRLMGGNEQAVEDLVQLLKAIWAKNGEEATSEGGARRGSEPATEPGEDSTRSSEEPRGEGEDEDEGGER